MSRIASVVKEEIKMLNIVDVISPHVELHRKGTSVMGLCPFHNEKTPSFHVNEKNGYFKCFGCNEKGDAITFIMRHLNLEYQDAVVYLCEQFGIELRYENETTPHKSFGELKELHNKIMQYAKNILFSPAGGQALEYLTRRGFSKEIIDSFDLGYMPFQFNTAAFEKEFSTETCLESGIFYKGHQGLAPFFGNRILFPIRSNTGACIAFSGRTMDPADRAKYKNSPETPLFSKRKELYNLCNAKTTIKESGACYIVEGYFDAMRMVEAGYTNTVAIMGTAFTKEQVSQLRRYAEEFNLVLDGDEAGRKAMRDSRTVALDMNIYPHVIFLPAGDDPDSLILKKGKAVFDDVVSQKEDLLLNTIRTECAKGTDPNRKFHRLGGIKRMLQLIKDPYRRDYYTEQTAEIFDVNLSTLSADIKIDLAEKTVKTNRKKQSERNYDCERNFLSLLVKLDEERAQKVIDDITPEYLMNDEYREIYKKIIELSGQSDIITVLINDPNLGESASELLINDIPEKDVYAELYVNKHKILQNYYIQELERIKTGSFNNDEEKLKAIIETTQKIKKIDILLTGRS